MVPPPGLEPETLYVPNEHDEIRAARDAVHALVRSGVHPHHILVLHWRGYETDRIASALCAHHNWRAAPAHSAVSADEVRVSSLDAATGLEAPYVVIVELRGILEAEKNPTLNHERDQLVLDNSRKIFMAFTRAGYRLLLIWSGVRP